jgi:hypothetical protein
MITGARILIVILLAVPITLGKANRRRGSH